MSLLPSILAQQQHPDTGQVVLELDIPLSLPHFAGHFPGYPILPGIVQLDWAIAFGREFFQFPGMFQAVERLKFNAPVLPDCRLILTLDYAFGKDGNSTLLFSYQKEQQAVSSGRVVFGAAA